MPQLLNDSSVEEWAGRGGCRVRSAAPPPPPPALLTPREHLLTYLSFTFTFIQFKSDKRKIKTIKPQTTYELITQ